MTRRFISTSLVLALLAVACAGEAAPETTVTSSTSTSTSSTSTTLPPTTTTTTLPFAVEGAPEDLTAVIEGFYDYATGTSQTAPAAPQPVLAGIEPKPGESPRGGKASMGTFKGQGVAVVEVAGDTFLTVNDGKGWRIVGGNWPSLSVPAFYGTGPRIVAVVGSDARPGEDMATARADSIHFVGLDGAGSGAIVGLPRDSWVPIAGHGRGKVNGSLSSGGPETMMATFANLTGLPLEGYVLTGFRGFQNLLGGVLGAVSVKVPFPINDRWAKVSLDAGRQDLDGAQALGFSRARKTVPNGDFTRSAHQGMVLLGAAQAVQAMGMSAIPGLMELSEPHLITSLTPEHLLTFSAMAISADLSSISNVVTPGSPGSAGSASVVYLASSVGQLWADLADGRLGS